MTAADPREERIQEAVATGHLRRISHLTSIPERFWLRVRKGGPEECWIWTAGRRSTGYGAFYGGKGLVNAHRYAYELMVGPIPPGLVLDHRCKVRLCVNPAHLEPVTNKENVLRGAGFTAWNAVKTHCEAGHEFTPENTYIRQPSGHRTCRACKRAADRRRRAA